MLLSACESFHLDDTLSVVQDFKEDLILNQQGQDAVEANKIAEKAEMQHNDSDNEDSEDVAFPENATIPEDDGVETDAVTVIDNKRTTPATESIRYTMIANETIGETAYSALQTIGHGASIVFGELIALLRELGIQYGPKIFRALKTTVVYLAIKTLKSILRVASLTKNAIYNYQTSMVRHSRQIESLKESCRELEKLNAVIQDNNKGLINDEVNQWSLVDGQCNFINANNRIQAWLTESFGFIEKNILHDIDQTTRFLSATRMAPPAFPVEFIQVNPFRTSMREQRLVGQDIRNPYISSYIYPQELPNKTILVALLPSKKSVDDAIRDQNLDPIKEAYHSSGIFLTVSNSQKPVTLFNNYMNPKQLMAFLEGLSQIAKLGYQETSLYKKINGKLPSLKTGFQHYLNWLQGDEKQRQVSETFSDFVAMKQSFIARVYIPAAMDSHDYLSTYLTNAKRFARENLKALEASVKNSAE